MRSPPLAKRCRSVQRVERKPDTQHDTLHLALVVVAAQRLVLLQQLGVATLGTVARCPVTPLYLKRAGRQVVLQPEQRVERGHHLVAQRSRNVVLRHLRNVRDPQPGAPRYRSRVSLELGQQHSQQRGLAAAVRPHQTYSGLFADLDTDSAEYLDVPVEEPEL